MNDREPIVWDTDWRAYGYQETRDPFEENREAHLITDEGDSDL